jgi:hypothetical protein
MNTYLKAALLSVGVVAAAAQTAQAQADADADVLIFRAMNDELQRSVRQMSLEKYKPPFFLAYQLADVRTLTIKATLGELRQSQENPIRTHNVRLMVGDYALNNENFVGGRSGYSSGVSYLAVPLENDYDAIRRAFWSLTDRQYKSALERYDQKLAALKQQNKSDSEKLDDYSKIVPTTRILAGPPFRLDKARWEKVAKEVSGLFRSYDQIMSSTVFLVFVDASCYLTSNEGTMIKCPVNLACLWINVFTQAEDGEPLTDQLTYCAPTPDQLPSVEQIKLGAKGLAEFILALRQAPVFTEAYSGPVLFEDGAVAELIAQSLFDESGLIASREPVYAVENEERQARANRLEAKVNQRICSNKITIEAVPKMTSFNNQPLVGSYAVDAEGVMPRDELVLVEKGILKTLLNDRVPTLKVRESNGHSRPALSGGRGFSAQKAPGVIRVSYADGSPWASFRQEVLRDAANDGLTELYAVRKLLTSNPGMNREMYYAASKSPGLSQPVAIYRVSVRTGEEQLVRSAMISDFPITSFKHILQGCKEPWVHNTVYSRGGVEQPVTFIVPRGLVFDDISLEKVRITKPRLRLVPNPVLVQN